MGGFFEALFGSRRRGYTDPKELEKALKDPSATLHLVDVRTAAEYAEGHIPGARNIPYDEIADRPPTESKDESIVVYCRSGSRSGMAKQTLESMGYTKVTNFGGLRDWPFDVEA